jgi:imidazolonepropionase
MEEGVTTIEIKSGYGLDIENERKMLLVATMLEKNFPITIKKTFLAHIIPHEYQKERETYLDKICNDIIPAFVKEELIDAVDVFCENIAFSMEETESIFKCAKKYNLPVKIHAEQLSNSGAAKLAVQYKALSADHLECLDEEGVKCIKESGTVATLLPGAYYFLREEKRPPIELFRKYQVNMAVSTDLNPGTSPFASILLILNMACLLYSLTPAESLKGVTINAAKALGIENTSGSIDKGKDADFVIWDILSPVMLVYQYGINPLIQVIKKGEVSICMKNL